MHVEQSERFRMTLMETRDMTLYHSRGESNPYKTILTEQEFCGVLAEIRDSYDMREKIVPKLRICEFEDSGTGDRFVSRRAIRCSIYQDINLSLQAYAEYNHMVIDRLVMEAIVSCSGKKAAITEQIYTTHNYIDFGMKMLRKGAVAAPEGKKLVIPFNMCDGLIICRGKGNE